MGKTKRSLNENATLPNCKKRCNPAKYRNFCTIPNQKPDKSTWNHTWGGMGSSYQAQRSWHDQWFWVKWYFQSLAGIIKAIPNVQIELRVQNTAEIWKQCRRGDYLSWTNLLDVTTNPGQNEIIPLRRKRKDDTFVIDVVAAPQRKKRRKMTSWTGTNKEKLEMIMSWKGDLQDNVTIGDHYTEYLQEILDTLGKFLNVCETDVWAESAWPSTASSWLYGACSISAGTSTLFYWKKVSWKRRK